MVISPLFVGPVVFLVGAILAIALILVLARVVVGIAWRVAVVGAIVLGVLWLLGYVGSGSPFPG